MTRRATCLFSAALCLPFSLIPHASPAQPPSPSPTQPATQAILAGKLIDVRTGAVHPHAYILIAGDRVQAIAATAPAGIPVTGLSACTLLRAVPAEFAAIDAHL